MMYSKIQNSPDQANNWRFFVNCHRADSKTLVTDWQSFAWKYSGHVGQILLDQWGTHMWHSGGKLDTKISVQRPTSSFTVDARLRSRDAAKVNYARFANDMQTFFNTSLFMLLSLITVTCLKPHTAVFWWWLWWHRGLWIKKMMRRQEIVGWK